VFYDEKGNVIDTIEKNISNLKRDEIQILHIGTLKAKERDIKSYNIKVANIITIPTPIVRGNDRIKILSHHIKKPIYHNCGSIPDLKCNVEITIKNITDKTVATAIFNAVFYDLEGNITDTIRHEEYEIKPNASRAITITVDNMMYGHNTAKRYDII
jgi:hypothetical protein